MKRLAQMHLVQYSFWDYETFNLQPDGTAFLGPNGAGKTSLLDAIQVALLGGHGSYTQFNTQSIYKDRRSLRDYALGMLRSGEGEQGTVTRKRSEAISYITLVFEGASPADCVSSGICIHAHIHDKQHRVLGLYVLPGVRLTLSDHLGALDQGGKAPLDWTTFDALARRLAKESGRTPTITVKAEAYLDELLHAIGPRGRSIDRDKLARAWMRSLRLKNVTSVDDYLRGYLVDAQPIDKQGTLKHIRTVRALNRQIEEVGAEIAQLQDVERRFGQVQTQHRQQAAIRAVRLQLMLEAQDENVLGLTQEDERLQQELRGLTQDKTHRQQHAAELTEAHERLLTQFNADPAARDPAQLRLTQNALARNAELARREPHRLALSVREALERAAALPLDPGTQKRLAQDSAKWEQALAKGSYPELADLDEVLRRLALVQPEAQALQTTHRLAKDKAEKTLQATTGKVRAAQRGIQLREEDDVAIALDMLTKRGIESHPVASLISVADHQWQGAIESFLGRNRYALVVADGREDDAVGLIRPGWGVRRVRRDHVAVPEARLGAAAG